MYDPGTPNMTLLILKTSVTEHVPLIINSTDSCPHVACGGTTAIVTHTLKKMMSVVVIIHSLTCTHSMQKTVMPHG